MRCRSCQPTSDRRARGGMSLVEMMVAVGVGSLVLMAVTYFATFTAKSFAAIGNYTDLDRSSRNALDHMSRDIRQAMVVLYAGTNSVRFQNIDSNSWFAYSWNPSTKQVTRTTGLTASPSTALTSQVILNGCDYFCFRIWLRNPVSGFWFPYSAESQPKATKLVDVSWRCSRRVLNQLNTESVQTAKIVLRN